MTSARVRRLENRKQQPKKKTTEKNITEKSTHCTQTLWWREKIEKKVKNAGCAKENIRNCAHVFVDAVVRGSESEK